MVDLWERCVPGVCGSGMCLPVGVLVYFLGEYGENYFPFPSHSVVTNQVRFEAI